MKKISFVISSLLLVTLSECSFNNREDKGKQDDDGNEPSINEHVKPLQIEYSNPLSFVVGYGKSLGYESIADPFVIHSNEDGYFYLVASNTYCHDSKYNTFFDYGPIWRSVDLSKWEYLTTVFPNQADDLNWLEGTTDEDGKIQINAPNLAHIGDYYIYYYTLTRGHKYNPGIGYAYAHSMEGPWTNGGKLFRSDEIEVKNSSDQDVFVDDDGSVYMSFGSGDGIWLIELTSDGMGLKNGLEYAKENKIWLAGKKDGVAEKDNYEGANIAKKDGNYYLYLSTGGWSGGINSKYHTLVGKSNSVKGPYIDSLKRDLKEEYRGDDVLLANQNTATGVGHSNIFMDDNGQEWIFYHGYDQTGRGNPNTRILFCDKIIYDKSTQMPYVEGHTPKYGKQTGPYVKGAYNE